MRSRSMHPVIPIPRVPITTTTTDADQAPTALSAPAAALDAARRRLAVGAGRTGLQVDCIVFTASCPRCSRDAEWTEERLDTRLKVTVDCICR